MTAATSKAGVSKIQSIFVTTSGGLNMPNADWGSYNRSKFAFAVAYYRTSSTEGYLMQRQDSGGTGEFTIRFTAGGGFQFDADGVGSGTFRMNDGTFNTGQWYNLYFIFDYLNGTSGDRMKVYSNGVALTPDTYTAPSSAVNTTTSDTYLGKARSGGTGLNNGYLNQPAFFSGNFPAASSIYNAGGKFINLKSQANLYSLLAVPQGDVYEDYVLTSDWSGTATASSFTP